MEEHNIDIVEVYEQEVFKNVTVGYTATYEYCSHTDEYLETEEMIKSNNLAVKDAYRKKLGLLTSSEIRNIREKYGISQKDFSEILDWGKATITRYENHQVQDRAHDDILRKIDNDPKWLLDMLKRAKDRLSPKSFNKYYHLANEQYCKKKNQYRIDTIHAIYANFEDDIIKGCTELDLEKVVEVINYLAKKVYSLHKVKLMKLLWYSDVLNFKRHGKSITGLVYRALPMGAVSEGYDEIVLLDGVSFDVVCYGDKIAYKFKSTPGVEIKKLSVSELETIDKIINEFGDLNTEEIVDKMHNEEAYKSTLSNSIISYSFAEQLSLD
jgi:putative zinc finger/helix-turn-helix YgiT family protein